MEINKIAISPINRQTTSSNPLDLVTIEGSVELAAAIKAILSTYESCFREEVSPQPATVPPFTLDVDREKWDGKFANKQAPRFQSPLKEADLQTKATRLGIIEESQPSRDLEPGS